MQLKRKLSGEAVRSLMRKHRWTIRSLARTWGMTQKRIRFVREHGVTGLFADEWEAMLTGFWPDGRALARPNQ